MWLRLPHRTMTSRYHTSRSHLTSSATVCLSSVLQCCLLSYVTLKLTMSPPSSLVGPLVFVFWNLFPWRVEDSAFFLIFSKVCSSYLCLQRPSLISLSVIPSQLPFFSPDKLVALQLLVMLYEFLSSFSVP